jgi:hypothetical protein
LAFTLSFCPQPLVATTTTLHSLFLASNTIHPRHKAVIEGVATKLVATAKDQSLTINNTPKFDDRSLASERRGSALRASLASEPCWRPLPV